MSKGPKKWEDVYRIYHEVEDVGKTVKASKRRARWTFCFGEDGLEKEVILIHSVVSGKKVVNYNGREIYHSDEHSRAFSYNWYDGEHVIRIDIVDIVEVGTQIAKSGADKMYELTLDGVPFNVLPVKPMSLPGRRSSSRSTSHHAGSSSARSADLSVDDDFNPRSKPAATAAGASNHKPKTSIAKPLPAAPAVDLLGASDGGFDAFAAPPTNNASQRDAFHPLGDASFGGGSAFMAPTQATFDPFSGGPKAQMGADQLARELEGLTFNAAPFQQQQQQQQHHQQQQPSRGSTDFSGFQAASPRAGTEGQTRALAAVSDVDKVTASLVNLTNLMDDGSTPQISNVYKHSYTDYRSLEEMKATQGTKAGDPKKPVMIERPVPPVMMGGGPRPPAPPMMGAFMPPRPPQGMMPMMAGGLQAQPFPGTMGQGQGPAMGFPQQPGPSMGFPQQVQPMARPTMPMGMGMGPAPMMPMTRPVGGPMGAPRPMPRPQKDDPFAGLGL